jgi:hypothetical protein
MYMHSCFRSARKTLFAVSMLPGLMLMPFAAQAIEVNGIVKLGLDFGGDRMAKGYFTNGDSSEINANDGLLLAGGVSITNDARNFALDATLGWKSASIDASNQDYEFTRYPLDVLAFYNVPLGKKNKFNLRIGGGLTYVMNPKFSASGSFDNFAANFENATGGVGQVDTVIKFNRRLGINAGLRLTNVEYRVKGVTGSLNGNGAGLFVAFVF